MTRARWLALLALVTLAAGDARAHALGVSRGVYRATPEGASARLTFDASELGAAVDPAALERRITSRLLVSRGGRRCDARLVGVEPAAGQAATAAAGERAGLTLDVDLSCAGRGTIELELGFWDDLRPGHRHVASADAGARVTRALMFAGAPRFELVSDADASAKTSGPAPRAPGTFLGWLGLGVEHILSGYDHLLFLLSLLLVATELRAVLAVISAFTLAHSTTLVLAATGACALPSALVEPVIALSICWVAVDNIRAPRRPERSAIVFAFGLIHGFGFAGALRELGLDALDNVPALFAFNLGVELGQLALAGLALPALRQLSRHPAWKRRAVPALSGVIAVLGVVWFTERVVASIAADALATKGHVVEPDGAVLQLPADAKGLERRDEVGDARPPSMLARPQTLRRSSLPHGPPEGLRKAFPIAGVSARPARARALACVLRSMRRASGGDRRAGGER